MKNLNDPQVSILKLYTHAHIHIIYILMKITFLLRQYLLNLDFFFFSSFPPPFGTRRLRLTKIGKYKKSPPPLFFKNSIYLYFFLLVKSIIGEEKVPTIRRCHYFLRASSSSDFKL